MFEGIGNADLKQLFLYSLIFFNKKPVNVVQISGDNNFQLLDLKTQKKSSITYPEFCKHATPPYRRLGMVNADGGAFWTERIPSRQWLIGYSNTNTAVRRLQGCDYQRPALDTVEKLRTFSCMEYVDTLFNVYPSLEEAAASVREFGGCIAFDKQFAINSNGGIFFKDKYVGELPAKKKKVEHIVFAEKHKHLILLLEGNYEKDLRDFASA